ncbi:DUF4253 domain-containing protein [Actinoplanes sp. NEAU-A12]|uniref:DUF4253 domain-containing protein n=1 Tax=Actinoplanes sandaracinus TaxID=3045177 RepID=A0ABT6WVB1_9ACTN|nr:DUF4253 domain-containing protein [Actinoplanes sandaracinus]MDI6103550.1 DUF4253 domain-containing protein [Actinoplanes sandaracinus]
MSGSRLAPLSLKTDPTDGGWEQSLGLLWVSSGPPSPGWWSALHEQHGSTGLWPLLLGSLSESDPDRPWRSDGDLRPDQIRSRPGDHYPGAVLGNWWSSVEPEEEDDLDTVGPYRDGWPGLARRGEPQADPTERAAEVADLILAKGWLTVPRLGLVPSARGADALTDAAWTGPANHENDTAKISCVLRNWEDRFGVRVVAAGFDILYLSVAAPPADLEHATEVAAEHHAFCPDNVWQGCGSLTEYAEELVNAPLWSFWWD